MTVMPIEWGKVREYARATGAARPVYLDDPRAPIPPTFLATVVLWMPIGETIRAPEVLEACESAGIAADFGALLSLEQEYVFHGPPPRGGQTLHASEELQDITVKQGRQGPMVMVRFAVSFRDAEGNLRAECRYLSAYVRKGAL
jgi:hypothetical protein